MQLSLVAVGKRMPGWVAEGAAHYTRQLPRQWRFQQLEVAQSRAAEAERRKADEAELLLRHCPADAEVVALDLPGRALSSEALSRRLADWQQHGRPVRLLVGGPDGLAANVIARADWSWSLSALTLPHPLVRVLLVEQLFRAHTILHNHPYHRA